MQQQQQLIELVAKLAEARALAAPEWTEAGFAALEVQAGVEVHFQYVATVQEVLMFVMLGSLPELNRGNIIEYAMTANLFWRRTAGATLAYEKEHHTMVLQVRLGLLDLDLGLLAERVDSLAEVADLWLGLIRKANGLVPEDDADNSAPVDAAGLMTQYDPTRFA